MRLPFCAAFIFVSAFLLLLYAPGQLVTVGLVLDVSVITWYKGWPFALNYKSSPALPTFVVF